MLAIRQLLTRTNILAKVYTLSKDCISVILTYYVVKILCLGEICPSECVENRICTVTVECFLHYGR